MLKFENMDLQTRKINFVKTFLDIKNDHIISSLEYLLTVELENNLSPMDMETFNKRVDQSIDDSINERVTDNDTLLKEMKKWA